MSIGGHLDDDFIAGGIGAAVVHAGENAGAVHRGGPDASPAIVGGSVIAERDEAVDIAFGQGILGEVAGLVGLGGTALLLVGQAPGFITAAAALIHFEQAIEAGVGPVEIGQRSGAEGVRHDYRS